MRKQVKRGLSVWQRNAGGGRCGICGGLRQPDGESGERSIDRGTGSAGDFCNECLGVFRERNGRSIGRSFSRRNHGIRGRHRQGGRALPSRHPACVANRYNNELIRAVGAGDCVVGVDIYTSQDSVYWPRFGEEETFGKDEYDMRKSSPLIPRFWSCRKME